MERKLYLRLYSIVVAACQRISHPGVVFPDRWILPVYFRAVLHDRPTRWACDPANWPSDLAPARLPSQPTMSRRLRTGHIRWPWWSYSPNTEARPICEPMTMPSTGSAGTR